MSNMVQAVQSLRKFAAALFRWNFASCLTGLSEGLSCSVDMLLHLADLPNIGRIDPSTVRNDFCRQAVVLIHFWAVNSYDSHMSV